MSIPHPDAVPVRADKREAEDRMPVRSANPLPQPPDFVTVVETILLRERPGQTDTDDCAPGGLPAGRCLFLRLHNGTDETVNAVTLRIEQLDRRGGSLGVSDYTLTGFSAGAGEDFVPDSLILTDNACAAVRAEVLTAEAQGFRLVRADGRTVAVCPEPEPVGEAPDAAYTTVRSRRVELRTGAWPVLLSLLALTAITAAAVFGREAAVFLYARAVEPALNFFRSLIWI